jgi:hypothetical protein
MNRPAAVKNYMTNTELPPTSSVSQRGFNFFSYNIVTSKLVPDTSFEVTIQRFTLNRKYKFAFVLTV